MLNHLLDPRIRPGIGLLGINPSLLNSVAHPFLDGNQADSAYTEGRWKLREDTEATQVPLRVALAPFVCGPHRSSSNLDLFITTKLY